MTCDNLPSAGGISAGLFGLVVLVFLGVAGSGGPALVWETGTAGRILAVVGLFLRGGVRGGTVGEVSGVVE